MLLYAVCEVEGCDARALVRIAANGEEPVPLISSENYEPGRAGFIIDSGWTSLPEGWEFGAVDHERCPAHVGGTNG